MFGSKKREQKRIEEENKRIAFEKDARAAKEKLDNDARNQRDAEERAQAVETATQEAEAAFQEQLAHEEKVKAMKERLRKKREREHSLDRER